MICLSCFDGMSCGQIAFERAGISIKKYYASEIDKYAIQVTMANYPDTVQLGSITEWQSWNIEKPDIIIGGSPCQGFSFAGKQLNFEDERSKLFFTFVDILKHYKPKYFLLENVIMKKEYNDVISGILGEIYPECITQGELFRTGRLEPIQINSALVSAQNRNRLYWTNIQGITQPKDKGVLLKDIIENREVELNKSNCLQVQGMSGTIESRLKRYKEKSMGTMVITGGAFRGRNTENSSDRTPGALTEQRLEINETGKSNALTSVSKDSLCIQIGKHNSINGLKCVGGLSKNKKWIEDGKNLQRNFSQGERIYSDEGKSPTLSSCSGGTAGAGSALISNNLTWRKLTPIECERLQTVPDNYTNHVSNSQRYKMLGNGWTVDVIAHIFKNINELS